MMRRLPYVLLLCTAGCSNMGDYFPAAGNEPIPVDSIPTGAEVYVMGERAGVTPLQVARAAVFPNVYPKEKESLYGRVTLKKAGCADYTRTVSSEISSRGMHALLDCAPVETGSSAASGNSHQGESAEQRLERIRDLLNKGLITEDEAKKARERILNDL